MRQASRRHAPVGEGAVKCFFIVSFLEKCFGDAIQTFRDYNLILEFSKSLNCRRFYSRIVRHMCIKRNHESVTDERV